MQTRTSTSASMQLKRFQACASLCTVLSPPLLAASLVEGGEWAHQTKGRMLLYLNGARCTPLGVAVGCGAATQPAWYARQDVGAN
jgi:hypothetical protein